MTRAHVLICRGPDCLSRGAQETYTAFTRELAERDLPEDEIVQTQVGCVGPVCGSGPVVCCYPSGTWYGGVGPDDAAEIVDEDLRAGRPVERLAAARLGGTDR